MLATTSFIAVYYKLGIAFLIYMFIWLVHFFSVNSNFVDLVKGKNLLKIAKNSKYLFSMLTLVGCYLFKKKYLENPNEPFSDKPKFKDKEGIKSFMTTELSFIIKKR